MGEPIESRPRMARLTRRQVCTASAAMVATATATTALGQEASKDVADFLFVQTASAVAFTADENRLVLRGVSPVTLFFSDRPDRIAGNMSTQRFVPFWSEGKDSFLSDPPNADVSILEKGKLLQSVVVLQDPVLEGDDLHYTVRILKGDMPVLGDNVSLFIDVIGMPRTPVSFAGVDRRAFRRAAVF